MSDPNNQYPAFNQSPYGQAPQGTPQSAYGQAPYGQAPQGVYGQAQPGYGQAPQGGRVQLSVYPSFCLKGLMHDE